MANVQIILNLSSLPWSACSQSRGKYVWEPDGQLPASAGHSQLQLLLAHNTITSLVIYLPNISSWIYKYCKPQFAPNKKQPKDLHKEEKTGLKQRLAGITCVRIGWVAEKRGRPIWPPQLSSGLSFHSWGGCRYIFTFCRVCNPESSVLCCQGFLDIQCCKCL